MNALPELARSEAKVKTSASHEGDVITLRLAGEAAMDAMATMESVLASLHEKAQALGVASVAIDLTQLEFMNSSCFKAFVSWIDRVQQMDAQKQYRIRFVSNPAILWQRRSLHALQCFASELISIDR